MNRIKTWYLSHKYCLVLLYIPFYLLYFGLLELSEAKAVFLIHCPLDDIFPTIPVFFLAYAAWWVFFPGSILWFLFKESRESFLGLCFILFSGYTICLLIYTFFPNGINIREPLAGRDFCSMAILWLRSIDPPRNVCPSMHVSSTVAIDIAVRKLEHINRPAKALVSLTSIMIILSTLFIRQHSIVDVFFGLLLSVSLSFVWYRFLLKRVAGE